MKIYLIRHGETNTNREKRYVGWTDVDLSAGGYQQAEKLSRRFAAENIASLYSSDLKRAENTAAFIGKAQGLKPITALQLREINFGEWEGLTHDEIEESYGEKVKKWIDDPFEHLPPRGESLADVSRRAESFLEEITANYGSGEAVVVVSHGGVIRVLLHSFLNLSMQQFWDITIDNASVSLVWRERSNYHVVYVNDTAHLQE